MQDTRELPKHFDFSNDGHEWVCAQVNSRKPLTMEYRKQSRPELPYYAVERREYYRFCRVHVEGTKWNEDGTREYSAEEIKAVILEYVSEKSLDEMNLDDHGGILAMGEEILRLRERVEELQKVAKFA